LQNIAGWRIEPPVSVPVLAGASPAATAAAEPPEEPPGTRDVSHGFFTEPKNEVSFDEPIANSSMFNLPSVTMPASAMFLTTVDVYGATKFSSIFEPQVVRQPSIR
jgi:hypothetical protein